MTPIRFRGYGVNGTPVTIIAERISYWREDSYNGMKCTEIHLDTGDVIKVDCWGSDVEEKVAKVAEATKE